MPRIFPSLLLPILLLAAPGRAGEPPEPKPGHEKEAPVTHPSSAKPKHTNALAKETSPYLLQHAHNPVDWHPWGPEAFAKAKKEDKPIFLSVGYSSCHWCHVMERESFENEEVAKILNEHFVSIKVDREERPDVDEIYMTAVQLLTKHGGWPMSVFMSVEGKPFYGGTYFPPEDSLGRTGFKSLLRNVGRVWKEQRADILEDAEKLSGAIQEQLSERRIPAQRPLDRGLIENCVDRLHENFDEQLGGFGRAPKFPPNNGLPLLQYAQTGPRPDSRVRAMIALTLDRMAMGGIHDHLAGGFHRYSTDPVWLVPHFEKMLYDNALLSRAYAEASVAFNIPEYARVARGVYDWVLREMTAPQGGFYSTLDADSEGHEGKFYVWTKAEVDKILGADAELFCSVFNIRETGNFREEATREDTGTNIPHLTEPLSAHATRLKADEATLRAKVDACKAKLLALRIKRVWPGLDDKILTAWNGLMISSLARGAVWLKEPRYKDAAIKGAEFLLKNLRTPEGRWLATHRQGQSKLAAYLDDHAFLSVAFLDLFDATGDERWKKEAIAIVALMDKHFADAKGGGYFFTADDHEKLLARTKDPIDKAIPSGNGWAAQALVRLAKLTGEKRYAEKAAKLFEDFQGLMERLPHATESLLLALGYYLDQTETKTAAPATPPVKDHASVTRGPVMAELFAGQSALRRGAAVPIAGRFTTDKGWHIQANSGGAGVPPALVVSLSSKNLGALRDVKFPEPQTLKAPALGGEMNVYSGTITISGVLDVLADAPLGRQALEVKVRFQACNDKVCEAPQDVTLSLNLDVVPADAEVKAVNAALFESLKTDK